MYIWKELWSQACTRETDLGTNDPSTDKSNRITNRNPPTPTKVPVPMGTQRRRRVGKGGTGTRAQEQHNIGNAEEYKLLRPKSEKQIIGACKDRSCFLIYIHTYNIKRNPAAMAHSCKVPSCNRIKNMQLSLHRAARKILLTYSLIPLAFCCHCGHNVSRYIPTY